MTLKTARQPLNIVTDFPESELKFKVKHEKTFVEKSLFASKRQFPVEVIMASNVIAPSIPNQFQIKADNTQMKQTITAFRMSLVRTAKVTVKGHDEISVTKEEIAAETHKGEVAGQCISFNLALLTPREIVEKHVFANSAAKC